MKKETINKFLQFVKFGIVGLTNNIIFYIFNIFVLWLFHPKNFKWDYIIANIVGFLISVLWSFYWNNKYVFKINNNEKRSPLKTLLKTYIAYGFTGIVLNNLFSYIWIERLGISKYIAPIINLFITVPLNFILNKIWAFRTTEKEI